MDHRKPIGQFLMSFLWPVKVEERRGIVTPRLEVYLTNGRYVLDAARVNYSFGGLHTVFRKVFSRFDIRQRELAHALILGFGAGSVARILRDEYKKTVLLTGVEKDPVVIELAKKYFAVDRYENLSLLAEDAGDFVDRCDQQFDLIVVDIFVGLDVPPKFWQDEFLAGVGRLLSRQGISFFNVVIHDQTVRTRCADLFKKMEALVGRSEFCPIPFEGTENWVFVCDRSRA